METVISHILLKQILDILKNYLIFTLSFLPKREKINKCEKLICCIEDKEKYVAHIRALKQALNQVLKLKKVHKVTQFNQKAWFKKRFWKRFL